MRGYSTDPKLIDRLIVSSYLLVNKITVVNNSLLKSLIIQPSDKDYECLKEFVDKLKKYESIITLEHLIELFEFVISPSDKVINGAVYTPTYIKDYIVKKCLERRCKDYADLLIADISCGCGGFLVTATTELKKRGFSYKSIYSKNIYGLDITGYSVERSKIVLSILALQEGEDDNFVFNLYTGDAIVFDWINANDNIKKNGGLDLIVGNPPYVCSKNISPNTKQLLKRWSVSNIGNTDLYIPFFQIGITHLSAGGILGYITVNSFIKSLNGRELRKLFSANKIDLSIIDFGGEQVFSGRSTYTCICFITNNKTDCVKYISSNSRSIESIHKTDYTKVKYADINDNQGWTLSSDSIRTNILKIETIGKPLGDIVDIKNGFATLRNNIFVFKPIRQDENYFYNNINGIEFKIERKICRDAIKPNILKSTKGIEGIIEKIIFPYQLSNNKSLKLFDEEYFMQTFPYAYSYLLNNKAELAQRDKGNKKYENWFAFGRNQALTISGYKLFFPYMSDKPYFVFSDNKSLLFYNGYAIVSNNKRKLLILEKILNSDIFWYYITNNSKPYSSDYYALAKNHIRFFGVCDLSPQEEEFLLNTSDSKKINQFLCDKYQLKNV